MSTSIQEQDLIQTIKQLEQRISDLERQQKSMTGEVNATSGTFTDTVNVNGTLQSSASGARWDINNTPRMRFFDATRERMRLTQDRIEFWDNTGASAGAIVGGNESGVPSVSSTGVFYAPSAFIGFGITVGGLILETDIPGSSSALGTAGEVSWDNDYIYICVATNTWKRVALSSY